MLMLLEVTAGMQPRYHLGRVLRAASILTLLLLDLWQPIFEHYSLFFSLSKSLSLVGFPSSFRAKAAGKKWKATAMETTRPSPVAPLLPRAISLKSLVEVNQAIK